MMFKEMNPEEVWKQLEGHENIVSKEMKSLMDYFEKLLCQHCKGSCRPILRNESLFKEGSILPDYLAECNDCGTVFTPYTRIELSGPTKDPHSED